MTKEAILREIDRNNELMSGLMKLWKQAHARDLELHSLLGARVFHPSENPSLANRLSIERARAAHKASEPARRLARKRRRAGLI